MGSFRIHKNSNESYYFSLYAGNSKIILTSEGYSSLQQCKSGIASVKGNCSNDKNYKKEQSKNGQFYFVLLAANGEPLGTSEMYETSQGRDKGIESVKENAPSASIIEI